jgi:hypothetical protein
LTLLDGTLADPPPAGAMASSCKTITKQKLILFNRFFYTKEWLKVETVTYSYQMTSKS